MPVLEKLLVVPGIGERVQTREYLNVDAVGVRQWEGLVDNSAAGVE